MLEGSGDELESSGEAVVAVAASTAGELTFEAHEGGGGTGDGEVAPGGSNFGGDEEKGRGDLEGDKINFINSGGNRWPRQETLALLKIRSYMDGVFRDSALKGPLWEEVSRKLGELGYNRSAKKCKEKFDNVYKYHKRTKEGRSGKPEGKTYRFFDELQAFDQKIQSQYTLTHSPKPQPSSLDHDHIASQAILITRPPSDSNSNASHITTVPSIPPNPTTTTSTTSMNPKFPSQNNTPPFSIQNMSFKINNILFPSITSTSSSTASDEELEGRYKKKKRKWKDFFKRLTREVLIKQEEMQNQFLEAIDRRENGRMVREEAWRMQEMARINREHEILVQERSTAAAKDAAVIAFLHKLSGQPNLATQSSPQPQQVSLQVVQQVEPLQTPPQTQPPPQQQSQQPQSAVSMPENRLEIMNLDNSGHGIAPTSSSRWPKAEVHALINLRTSLDTEYPENGPKGPLWEDISAGMRRLGYNRSAKRCKEKWENINKYFKKVKEGNKERPLDSKTCPYFHQLDALYKEKNINNNNKATNHQSSYLFNGKINYNMMEPLIVQPEQQWRPPDHHQQHLEKDGHIDQNMEEDDDEGTVEDINGEEGVEDEGGSSTYEIATNKLSSMDGIE